MVIGSTINDLLKIATPTPSEIQSGGEERGASASKEPLSNQTVRICSLIVQGPSWE